MRINIVIKLLIVKAALWLPFSSEAWIVSDSVVELAAEDPSEYEPPVFSRLPAEQPVAFPANAMVMVPDSGKSTVAKQGLGRTDSTFEKNQAKLNPDEQGAIDHQRAVKHIQNGDTHQAKTLLENTLHQLPSHHLSRIELATVYIKEQKWDIAEALLQEGLRLDDNHSDFLRLMAVVYDKREEPERALSLLLKVKDSQKDKPYIAFLGHLYQQTGRYGLARQQYFRLLQSEPHNPLWLLGVSIALDAEGKTEAALEGYHRLKTSGNIEPKILDYVQDRIDRLKG